MLSRIKAYLTAAKDDRPKTLDSGLDKLHHITKSQLLLLDSLLLPEIEADRAFQRWLDDVDLDRVDFATYRLIPAVYARHVQGKPHLSNYGRMKGIYRFFHVRNTLLLADTRRAVAALLAAGIDVVAFKGLAWVLKYYERPAQRAMMDADILVSPQNFKRADEILQKLGWQYQHSDEHRRIYDHSVDLTNASGRALDLHVRTLLEVQERGFDELVFAGSQPLDWNGLPIRVVSPEHLVLIGLVNAVREPAEFRLEWICDLARALAASPSFDWSAVCQLSHRYGVAAEVFDALYIAADLAGLNGIRTVLPGLARRRPSPPQPALIEPAADQSDAPGPAPKVRIFESSQGDIEALFLRWDLLAVVPRLFDIADRTAWEQAIRGLPRRGAGLLAVAPGLLKRAPATPAAYHASIAFVDPRPAAALAPGARMIIPLRITNQSEYAWTSYGAKDSSYGVSWHVYQANGEVAEWDMPRYYFLVPKEKYLVFIASGAVVECPLEFIAPAEPGDYVIRFDIVHEGVSWFETQPHQSPEWQISVAAPPN